MAVRQAIGLFPVTSAAVPLSITAMQAKAPNRKRAEQYLAASGAVPIAIFLRGEGCSIHTGSKITGTVVARWWIAARDAPRVSTAARQGAGANPDVSTATATLARAAASLGATLTDDATAISRASAAVVRLDAMLESMRRDGTLQEFNARYRAGRAAAIAEGRATWDSASPWPDSKRR
jgi:hypothetical protein